MVPAWDEAVVIEKMLKQYTQKHLIMTICIYLWGHIQMTQTNSGKGR